MSPSRQLDENGSTTVGGLRGNPEAVIVAVARFRPD
jgi:hypothetical protein